MCVSVLSQAFPESGTEEVGLDFFLLRKESRTKEASIEFVGYCAQLRKEAHELMRTEEPDISLTCNVRTHTSYGVYVDPP